MTDVQLVDGRLHFSQRLPISLHRTLRSPENSSTYPLPPSLRLRQVLARDLHIQAGAHR
jgi:hypothetical protein